NRPVPDNRPSFDPFRIPWLHWAGTRGTYVEAQFRLKTGERLDVELFAPLSPCSTCGPAPSGVSRMAGPYPGVVSMIGSMGQMSQQWALAAVLAESGYMVMLFNPPDAGNSDVSA